MPLISALGKLRVNDYHEFEASLGYMMSSGPPGCSVWRIVRMMVVPDEYYVVNKSKQANTSTRQRASSGGPLMTPIRNWLESLIEMAMLEFPSEGVLGRVLSIDRTSHGFRFFIPI